MVSLLLSGLAGWFLGRGPELLLRNRDPPVWHFTQAGVVKEPERQPYIHWTTCYDFEEMRNTELCSYTITIVICVWVSGVCVGVGVWVWVSVSVCVGVGVWLWVGVRCVGVRITITIIIVIIMKIRFIISFFKFLSCQHFLVPLKS